MKAIGNVVQRNRPQATLCLTFLVMTTLSWRRWTGMIVDIGRETDLPLRLLNGEVLYRDIHYMYGPLPPYLNALLYRIFGAHLDTLTTSGLCVCALVAFLAYRISTRLMPPIGASIATSLVIVLCLFRPAGNMVLPYSMGAAHALVFSLTALLFALRYIEHTGRRDLIIAGVFLGLTAISKQEFALASVVTIIAAVVHLHRSSPRKLVADLATAATPALIAAVPVFTALFATIDWRILIEDCHIFLTHLTESNIIFNRFRSGLDHPVRSLLQIAGAGALGGVLVAGIGLVGDRHGVVRRPLVALLAGSAVIAAIILAIGSEGWDGSPLRALPLFLGSILVLTWKRGRKPNDEKAGAFAFVIAAYSLTILLRVILRVPSGGFSGNALLPASLVLVTWGLVGALPAGIGRWTADRLSAMRGRRCAQTILVIGILAMMVTFGIRYRTQYTYPIDEVRGRLLAEPDPGATIERTLEFIADNTSVDEVIALLPEGNDLAFLSRRRINLRHQILIPDFMSVQDERDAIAALEREEVQFVFILNRPMSEFGAVAFGRDFYQTLGNWIEDNYDVVEVLGGEPGTVPEIGVGPFFVKVYRRQPGFP